MARAARCSSTEGARLHTDLKPGDRLFYFTTCGWMMWNWLVSGLASGATLLLYDGSPFHRRRPRSCSITPTPTKHDVFGTSAKYIDAVAKLGLEPARTHDLGALQSDPVDRLAAGAGRLRLRLRQASSRTCSLRSISGGTDIISCFVLGNPLLPVWRGEIQCRGLGMKVEVFDENGPPVRGEKGELVCTAPFPSMPVGFWNDPDGARYRAAYFERFPGVWCHGDYVRADRARRRSIIYGRSDAVLNPGGVRIGTAEIYRQVEQLDEVVESLAIGAGVGERRAHRAVRAPARRPRARRRARRADPQQIRDNTTPRHVPARIVQVADIPRTKSGKIVELAVRDVVHGAPVKNIEALANPEALAFFKDRPELRA